MLLSSVISEKNLQKIFFGKDFFNFLKIISINRNKSKKMKIVLQKQN